MENTDVMPVKGYDRRSFLSNAGKGIVATGLMSSFAMGDAAAQTGTKTITPEEETPVQFPPIVDPSEKPKPPLFTPVNPDKRIGFAIVGVGRLTLETIMPAFGNCKYAKPVALVSGDAAKAAKVADQFGINPKNIYNYQNFDTIKNNPEIQAVYIVLPNGMHEEYTVRAAKAGKHVLCEKPMANSSEQAKRMVDACEKAGKKLMIAYRIQYEPKNALMKDWTRDKKYGKVKLIDAVNTQNTGDPKQWRLKKALSGGGALPDIGLYCLNTVRYLLGEEPEWVNATTYSTPGDPRFTEVEEAVLWQMGFASGSLANCSTSYGVHETRMYTCMTDKGAKFGLNPAFSYKGLKAEASVVEGKNEFTHAPQMEDKDQFALEMDHFAQCIIKDQKPYTPGEEGLQDMMIMEAIYKSAKEGRVVKLDKVDKLDAFRGTPPKSEG